MSRSSVKRINNISLLIIRKRHHKIPLIKKQDKLATRGAQLVPIETLTSGLYSLVPNQIKMLSNKNVSASHTF